MFNHLPYFVEIKNKKYKINVDFRNMIYFEQDILNKELSDDIKIEKAIRNFYYDFKDKKSYNYLIHTNQFKYLVDKLIWFYKCGREDYHPKRWQGNEAN